MKPADVGMYDHLDLISNYNKAHLLLSNNPVKLPVTTFTNI